MIKKQFCLGLQIWYTAGKAARYYSFNSELLTLKVSHNINKQMYEVAHVE